MPAIETYPECLRRPNAGGHIQSRTRKTEQSYRVRFDGMIRTLCLRNRWLAADAYDLAIAVGERANHYARNSLKQFHATIRQNLRDRWLAGSISVEEVVHIDSLLQSHRPAPADRKVSAAQTSARRAKSVRPEQVAAITAALLSNSTPIRQITAALFEHGVELATRPSEFLTLGQDPTGQFWVRSAKYSLENGRGLQPARIVPTDHYQPWETAELEEISGLVAAERARGATFSRLLRRCQHAIRQARAIVGGRSRSLTAYTVRHQARANYVAMGLPAEEIAVIMGHASASTAQSHYSPGRRAWQGMGNLPRPTVDPNLVALVRPAHPSRGWDRSRGEAIAPAPKI